MRLLLVEDDQMLGGSLKKALSLHNYGVDWIEDGESALEALKSSPYKVVVLDINLPKLSGLEVLKLARQAKITVPVLLLTARDTPLQKVDGLDSGADDYLVKPFDLNELLARLRALVRRNEGRHETLLVSGEIELDPSASMVRKAGVPITLTAKEFKTLQLLMERLGKFVTKSEIEYTLYSAEDAAESNTVEVAVYNLRKKLGSKFIETIRGVGYRIAKSTP